MPDYPFLRELADELARSRFNSFTDNYDRIQLSADEPPPPAPVWKQCIGELLQRFKELAHKIVSSLRPFLRPFKRAFLYYFAPRKFFENEARQYEQMHFLHNLLGNTPSRNLAVKLFAYRILGHRQVKLPRNTPKYWQDIKDIEKYKTATTPIKIAFMDASLAQYDFSPLGYKLKVYATGPGSACAFAQKQYEYHCDAISCKAEPGDIAIDAGGCWGETTMYFAHEVGPNGKVVSFEFIPSNLAVMHANIAANPDLAKRVMLVEQPIWNYSGLKLYYVDWGPGSRITDDEKRYKYDGTCETVTIDDVVEQRGLPRVDFIKMDIEGAEFPALKGAEKTIRKFRPKLAISLYHQLSDFVTIPRFLYELNLGYDFYLDHHTIYQNETVLFAVPRKNFAVQPVPESIAAAA